MFNFTHNNVNKKLNYPNIKSKGPSISKEIFLKKKNQIEELITWHSVLL